MSNILRMFYVVMIMCVALLMSAAGYAGKVTTSIPLEIKGAEHYPDPTEYDHPGDPEVQLGITFHGVRAEGYTSGLITALIGEMDDDVMLNLPEHDSDILVKIRTIHVEATCVGSGKNTSMKPGMTLDCYKGDGLHIDLYQPKSPHKGIFTLTKTRDVKDEVAEINTDPVKEAYKGAQLGSLPTEKKIGGSGFDSSGSGKGTTNSSHGSWCILMPQLPIPKMFSFGQLPISEGLVTGNANLAMGNC